MIYQENQHEQGCADRDIYHTQWYVRDCESVSQMYDA